MKTDMRFLILSIAILLSSFGAAAEKYEAAFDKYSATIHYNAFTLPGDAVFVRVSLSTKDKYLKDSPVKTSGRIQIFSGTADGFDSGKKAGKDLGHTDFYQVAMSDGTEAQSISDRKTLRKIRKMPKSETVLAGVPLSSYFKTGDYTLLVTLNPFGGKQDEIALPLKVNEKEFVKETIQLDARNTSIKTNDSDERWKQIKKLNGILETRQADGVYDLGPYEAPTPATRRTSFFADRRTYAYTNGKSSTSLHYGIDYGIKEGSEVRACAAGKVVMAETRISTGWSTVIEHLPGLYSLYYHQKELKVKVGDIVQKGDLIGYSGMTGLATGPHLHWEMRLNMEAVSPDFFLGDFTFEKAQESRQN